MTSIIAAKEFVCRWRGRGIEIQDTQKFWNEFLYNVLEIKADPDFIEYEKKVRVDGFYNGPKLKPKVIQDQGKLNLSHNATDSKSTLKQIDGYVKSAKTLIEQKSAFIDLDEPIEQSDGSKLTAFDQAMRYNINLPYSHRARFLITCNFQIFRIYDLDNTEDLLRIYPIEVKLEELPEKIGLFRFFINEPKEVLKEEEKLSQEAVDNLAKLKDYLDDEYKIFDLKKDDLTILLIRLLFCLFAEDIELFENNQFLEYLRHKKVGSETAEFRTALINLFSILNTPHESRDNMLASELLAFPYVNGKLFDSEEKIDIPFFSEDSKGFLLEKCSSHFNWSKINPTIFGSLFESMLQSSERREGGMHYTSVENIRKVIDPLFLDELRHEFRKADNSRTKLLALQDKIASLTIFDPACGSGNFLTQTYLDLRELENEILYKLINNDENRNCLENINQKVSINQFYGIEINNFACEVAKVAMQIAKCQMDIETSVVLHREVESFPLETAAHIYCANALRVDWNEICPASKCNYIIGNPPFIGARNQTAEQKKEITDAFHGARNCGNIDYVAGWYAKACDYVKNENVRCAFVSTNSICQGEQVANVWKPIFDAGFHIDFAHNTFRWANEATDQAHVFCVIVGFSKQKTEKRLFMYKTPDSDAVEIEPSNINAYLVDAKDIFIYGRSSALCSVPKITVGSQPVDDGNYLFSPEEKNDFIKKEPNAEKFFHRWMGANEFINNKERFCLYLGNVSAPEIQNLPLCKERAIKVREFRLSSKRKLTLKAAETPLNFGAETIVDGTSIVIPQVSSERRKYIPIGFISKEIFCSDKLRIIPYGNFYHFGILCSQFQNAWMRLVSGRLKNDYQYANSLAYNCFVWPGVTKETLNVPVEECVTTDVRNNIEDCARAVLEAREFYVEQAKDVGHTCSLADMYDPDNDFLYPKLTSAHKALDKAVEEAYGVDFGVDEEKIVAHLFELYKNLTENDN